jgi:hypothetical protein
MLRVIMVHAILIIFTLLFQHFYFKQNMSLKLETAGYCSVPFKEALSITVGRKIDSCVTYEIYHKINIDMSSHLEPSVSRKDNALMGML